MAKFIVTQNNGSYHFNLKAANGETVLTSESYTSEKACLSGIEAVKHNSSNMANFEDRTAENGQHYFVLKAANKEIIGTSETYISKESMKMGIETVMEKAPLAEVFEA